MDAEEEAAALLAACARGDEAALRQLYDDHAPQLLGVAVRILRDRALAEDALHEAFVQIWRRAAEFARRRGSARGWMTSIVRYRAIDLQRRRRREVVDPDPLADAADEAPSAESAMVLNEEVARLRTCLDTLSADQRRTVALAYLEGATREDIAQRTGAPVPTVKSWLRRGLIALRECLER
ncbi:MAG: sigma-70 family RNA polymerase sigma factor [Alphaproteobacteria bacterium]